MKSGYYESLLCYDNEYWFVNEVIELENKMKFSFENTKEDINTTNEDGEEYFTKNTCRFCERSFESDKFRDHCHLTSKYRGPDHNKCNFRVTQKRSNFIPLKFHFYSKYFCDMLPKTLVDKKIYKVKLDIIAQTNEKYILVTYVCIRFVDSYRFLSSSLDKILKTLVDIRYKTVRNLKEEIVDNDEITSIVNEVVEEDKTFKDLKKEYPDKIEKIEEVLLTYTQKFLIINGSF